MASLRRPLRPADLSAGKMQLVAGGAQLADVRAGAVLTILDHEHRRRRCAGLRALTNLALLDALGSMPLDEPLPTSMVNHHERALLTQSEVEIPNAQELRTKGKR